MRSRNEETDVDGNVEDEERRRGCDTQCRWDSVLQEVMLIIQLNHTNFDISYNIAFDLGREHFATRRQPVISLWKRKARIRRWRI